MVHTEISGTFKEGDLVSLSDLGKKIFGDTKIGMIVRGPYMADSFAYDITPIRFVAYDVYLEGNLYNDFSESYLKPVGREDNCE